jgi:predicted acylesterase/phospholipase RssA
MPTRLRSYSIVDELGDDGATILEAACATSAATSFFEPVTIAMRKHVDGGLVANNPINEVWIW